MTQNVECEKFVIAKKNFLCSFSNQQVLNKFILLEVNAQ